MTVKDPLPPLREVIHDLGLSAKKSLSQNFILDLNLTRRIARAGGPLEGITVIEVGPGPGGLTRALLMEGAANVIAIERDERCLPALTQISDAYPGRLHIVSGDALTADLPSLARTHGTVRVISNLPYGIATPLLTGWLNAAEWKPWYDQLILMFQKEVADRIVAAPGSKAYGRLAVLSQWRSSARIAFSVSPQAFTPPPKVSSAVVQIVPGPAPSYAFAPKHLETVTFAAFGQRRKMLRSSLKSIFPNPAAVLAALEIEDTMRAEDLNVSDFCRMAEVFAASRELI